MCKKDKPYFFVCVCVCVCVCVYTLRYCSKNKYGADVERYSTCDVRIVIYITGNASTIQKYIAPAYIVPEHQKSK